MMTTPKHIETPTALPASITRKASLQTYYTIRLLADRVRRVDAYRAYAYFRWVDDTLDAPGGSAPERERFLSRQRSLLDACYRAAFPVSLFPEEEMLAVLVRHNPDPSSGLHGYLSNMMSVMAFDAERRGRLISAAELNEYTRWLACAVTEAVHYFIGHDCFSPRNESRYLAVTAAHITHMLRDTLDDLNSGYYNIPREVLEADHLSPADVHAASYREWVRSRVELARRYFSAGRGYLRQVVNIRCRLACLAYLSRFEGVLDSIEKDGFLLRAAYPERKTFPAMARAAVSIGFGLLASRSEVPAASASAAPHSIRNL